jgi:hypothetical protein
MRRTLLGLFGVLLLGLGLVGFAPAATAASAYHCHGNYCWRITSTSAHFDVGYSDGLYNDTAGKAPLTCETSRQITRKYSVSATAKADANFIFGSVGASVSGGLEKSSSTGVKITVGPVSVPAWTSERCQRGILYYTFHLSYCLGSSHGMTCKPITAHAPQGPSWRLTRTKIKH